MLQRAGEYVLQWSEELDALSEKMFGGSLEQSTLVKRGPKGSAEDDESGNPPAKRVKAEASPSDIDADIKRSMEKGTLSKVGELIFLHHILWQPFLTFFLNR